MTGPIYRNKPGSFAWQIDILTLADCASLVEREVLPLLSDAFTLAHYRDPAQAKVAFDMA